MNTETKMKTQHTPGQLTAAGCTLYQADSWRDGHNYGGRQVARCYPDPLEHPDECPTEEDAANTRRLALAWNTHDQLIAALRAIADDPYTTCRCGDIACAAINAAKENTP